VGKYQQPENSALCLVVSPRLVEREGFDDGQERIGDVANDLRDQSQRYLQLEHVGTLNVSDTPSPILLADLEVGPQKPSYRAEKSEGGRRIRY